MTISMNSSMVSSLKPDDTETLQFFLNRAELSLNSGNLKITEA